MGKREELKNQLTPILHDRGKLEQFIIQNCNLPGPRGNLELAFALAEVYDNQDVLSKWLEITEDRAGVNDPRSFLAFCAVICLGKYYTKNRDEKIITILKKSANDGRWRMREAVAFAFQIIGEFDFNVLKELFSGWIDSANNYEKRAILVSLAHPPLLHKENAVYCLEITDTVLKTFNQEDGIDVLKKGLEFTISVFAAANPEYGFDFIKRWIGTDKTIDKIMKENLKKNRLAGKYPHEVENLLDQIPG
jgi:hypothetical protein